jgi:hypothetical protein
MPRLEFTYHSRFFTSIKEACKHYDVSYVLTRKHMKDYHISVGEALDIERNKIKITTVSVSERTEKCVIFTAYRTDVFRQGSITVTA